MAFLRGFQVMVFQMRGGSQVKRSWGEGHSEIATRTVPKDLTAPAAFTCGDQSLNVSAHQRYTTALLECSRVKLVEVDARNDRSSSIVQPVPGYIVHTGREFFV